MKPWVVALLVLLGMSLLESLIQSNRKPVELDTGFSGTMDTVQGYENIPWQTNRKDIQSYGNYPCNDKDSLVAEIHNGVTSTKFYYCKDRLFRVDDDIPEKTATMEYLHERYGDFLEVDVANKASQEKGITIYTNPGQRRSLIIQMKQGYATRVSCFDYYTQATVEQFSDMTKLFQFDEGKWYTLTSLDKDEQMEHWYFVKKNIDGKYMVLNLNRSLQSEYLSTVRAGFGLGYGTYEIKANGTVRSESYNTLTLRDDCYDLRWEINYNGIDSCKDMLSLMMNEQQIQIRRNDTVYTFDPSGIVYELARNGFTGDELLTTIANEEF